MIKTIFLDVDDVLADFMGGLHTALNISYNYFNYPYKKGEWNILGYQIKRRHYLDCLVTFEECNQCCTTSFWQYLKWMHDGRDILRAVLEKFHSEQIYLLTTPMPNLESASGKMMWINDNLPVYLKHTIITQAPKYLLARPDTLLIDDKNENIDEFREAGGRALLVPRPWNRGYFHTDRTIKIVRGFLERLC